MSNYLFSGYSFSSDLKAEFKLQNLLQTQAGEEQQMSVKLLNRQSEGFAIGAKTPHGQTPKFVIDQILGGSTNNVITIDTITGMLDLNFNVDLNNSYKIVNSIAPTDDGDLANKLYVDNLNRIESIGITTNTDGLTITQNTDPSNPIFNIDLSSLLQNFSSLSTDGLVHKTGVNTFTTFAPSVTDGQVLTTNAGTFAWEDLARVTSIGLTTNTNALTITGTPVTDTGDINIDVSTSLQNLSNLTANGFIKQTGTDTFTNFTASATDNQVIVTNGSDFTLTDFNRVTSIGLTTASTGLSITNTPIIDNGNINVDLSARLENISNLSSLGLVAKDGVDTFYTIPNGSPSQFLGINDLGQLEYRNTGTVTSVGLNTSSGLSVIGSPITTDGVFNLTLDTALQNFNNIVDDGIVIKNGSNYATSIIPSVSGKILQTTGTGVEWITPETVGNVIGSGTSTLNSLPKITNATTTAISPSSIFIENDTDLNISGLIKVDTLKTTSNQDFISFNSGENRMYMYKSLRIPDGAGFDINTAYGYLNSSGGTGIGSGNNTYSIDCHDRVLAQEFNAHSSRTIKNILGKNEEITQEALDFFEQLNIVKYQYKDIIKEGDYEYFGVIAEELKEVLPHYVNDHHKFIPNIYCKGKTQGLHNNRYSIVIEKALPDITGNKVKIHTEEQSLELEILKIGDNSLIVKSDQLLPEEVFVYGTYEYSPTVAYNKLWGLGFVALKGMKSKLDVLAQQVQSLTSHIQQLTN